jgi:hypothetical protein
MAGQRHIYLSPEYCTKSSLPSDGDNDRVPIDNSVNCEPLGTSKPQIPQNLPKRLPWLQQKITQPSPQNRIVGEASESSDSMFSQERFKLYRKRKSRQHQLSTPTKNVALSSCYATTATSASDTDDSITCETVPSINSAEPHYVLPPQLPPQLSSAMLASRSVQAVTGKDTSPPNIHEFMDITLQDIPSCLNNDICANTLSPKKVNMDKVREYKPPVSNEPDITSTCCDVHNLVQDIIQPAQHTPNLDSAAGEVTQITDKPPTGLRRASKSERPQRHKLGVMNKPIISNPNVGDDGDEDSLLSRYHGSGPRTSK